MATSVESLLNIMRVRLSLQTEGITHPHPAIQAVTQQLVEKLSKLDPSEQVSIQTHIGSAFAQYIREATGEVLAEILETDIQDINPKSD